MNMRALARYLPSGRWAVIAIPFLWLLFFFAIPFLIVLKISFSRLAIAMPPYTPIVEVVDKALHLRLNLGNYAALFTDPQYGLAYLSSIRIAVVSTVLCLLIGYPMAYFIARMKPATRNIALMAVVLPSWTSFLIRVYAWIGILDANGILNRFLLWTGLVDAPLRILYTPLAAYIGIVYCYLPFMILPLYANLVQLDQRLLEAAYDLGARPWKAFVRITLPLMVLPLYANLVKLDLRLLEAAYDLGAKPWQAFLRITVPLSRSGIIAGCMLVMIPAVGEFVIPEMLGGPDTLMIGRVLWGEFFNNRDWPAASAVAIVMLLLLLVPILVFNRSQQRTLEGRLA